MPRPLISQGHGRLDGSPWCNELVRVSHSFAIAPVKTNNLDSIDPVTHKDMQKAQYRCCRSELCSSPWLLFVVIEYL